jgi:hypothetical protein
MIYAITLILLVLSTTGHNASGGAPAWTCDAALTGLFTPPHPVWGRYEVCTTDAPGEPPPAGFTYGPVELLEALDAFGTAGAYDRSRLAQLYGGRRARVIRGWKEDAEQFESVTLISPYPDASLHRLRQGTMIIRWSVERTRFSDRPPEWRYPL